MKIDGDRTLSAARLLARAGELRRAGRYPAAATVYRRAAAQSVSVEERLEAHLGLADVLRVAGDFALSRKHYRIVRRDAASARSEAFCAADFDAAVGAALCDKASGRYAALAKLGRLLSVARRRGDSHAEGFVLWHCGMALRFSGKPDAAVAALARSRRIFASLGERESEGFALCGLAGARRATGDAAVSLKLYKSAGKIFASTGDAYGRAYSLCGMANALKAMGKSSRAAALYRRSAAIYRRTGDLSSLAFVYKGLAGCSARGNPASARKYFALSEKLFRRARDERGLLSLYLEMLASGFGAGVYLSARRIARRIPYETERKYLKTFAASDRRRRPAPGWQG